MFRKVPHELKEQNRWCNWKVVLRDGKETKLPINAETGEFARSNDSNTWTSFETAVKNVNKSTGIGYFFKEPYIGIDIDDVPEEIERYRKGSHEDNIVSEFINTLGSYSEISPSGTGIHIIIKGELPKQGRRRGSVEIYDGGRFFTVTGNAIGGYNHIIDDSELGKINYLHKKYIRPTEITVLPTSKHGLTGHDLSDIEVMSRIHQSKQGQIFDRFLKGGWEQDYDSQSEADLAMANILAFWTAKNFSQMDRIFRDSSLMRDKWDEKRGKTTYGQATLNKAINDTQNVFEPKREPSKYTFGEEFHQESIKKEHPPRSYDDTGNAQRFLDRYEKVTKYSYVTKKFYIYDGITWKEDNEGLVHRLVDATIEDMKNEKIIVSEDMDEEEATALLQKHIKQSRSNRAKKNIIEELKHNISVLPDEFDQDDMLLNVANGYLDLSSAELHEHDRELLFQKVTNSEYTETATPDTWLSFLNDIFDHDQELIRFMQKALGYSMTGSSKEQMMFILLGNGRNGKSLFVNTVAEILGDYSSNMQAESLMVKRNTGSVNNDIARLAGARFVTSSEPNEGFVFDEGLIKQMTGDDKITARFLHQENFEFEAKFKIWLATNHRPVVRGTDDGIWRRLAVIPFDVQIPEHKVDKDLKYKLMREAPAILDWMLEGCLLWQREGLEKPKRVRESVDEYRKDMDITDTFIDEICEVGKGYEEAAGELYKEYSAWAKRTNEYDVGSVEFGKRMAKKFSRKRASSGNRYEGIRIKKDSRFGFIK